jgi:hypothetical protein
MRQHASGQLCHRKHPAAIIQLLNRPHRLGRRRLNDGTPGMAVYKVGRML